MSIEKQFTKVQERAGEEPDLERLSLEGTAEDYKKLAREHARLKQFFEGAQGYIKELEAENKEYKEAARENKELSETDALTGLLNVRGLTNKAQTVFEFAIRGRAENKNPSGVETVLNVIYIDLNSFKPINDTYGHQAGNQALIKVTEALRSVIRKGDLVARVGGDEFVVVFQSHEIGGKIVLGENRSIVTARISRALEKTGFTYRENEIPALTASIGAAKSLPGESLEELIHRADLLALEVKKEKEPGKSGVSVDFNPEGTVRPEPQAENL